MEIYKNFKNYLFETMKMFYLYLKLNRWFMYEQILGLSNS